MKMDNKKETEMTAAKVEDSEHVLVTIPTAVVDTSKENTTTVFATRNEIAFGALILLGIALFGIFVSPWQHVHDAGSQSTTLNSVGMTYTLVLRKEVLPDLGLRITVNGTTPGPPLHVQVNERVTITVINEMEDDYTTVHWHGMYQRGTPNSDGVISVSQCPIYNISKELEGMDSISNIMVYSFTPTEIGTFWYHGHIHEQYTDGLFGPFIVHENWTTLSTFDDWILMAADYYAGPASNLLSYYLSPASGGNEPIPDAYTVNGLFSENLTLSLSKYCLAEATAEIGSQEVKWTDCSVVKVRVINSAGFSMFTVSVDGLPLIVVELDGTSIEPIAVSSVTLNVAQRVSFLLNFTQLDPSLLNSSSIWIRFSGIPEMYATFNASDEYLGLYGATTGEPLNLVWKGLITLTSSQETATLPSYDENIVSTLLNVSSPYDNNFLDARPAIVEEIPAATRSIFLEIEFTTDENGVNLAHFNNATYSNLPPAFPVLYEYIYSSHSLPEQDTTETGTQIFGNSTHPFILPYGSVIEIFIRNTDTGEHPIHVHGHNFWILATSDYPEAETLYSNNYLRRDIVSVPAQGWAKIRFIANNPGVWMVHCHIEWHMRAGLAALFIEGPRNLTLNKSFYDGQVTLTQKESCDYLSSTRAN